MRRIATLQPWHGARDSARAELLTGIEGASRPVRKIALLG
jgi:hypothetical protein